MRSDEKIKLQYASKYASIANSWKKWIGENLGMKITQGIQRKIHQDSIFVLRVNANVHFRDYRNLISDLGYAYKRLEPFAFSREYYNETFMRNVDLVNFYQLVVGLMNTYEGRGVEIFNTKKSEILNNINGYFNDFNQDIDREVFAELIGQFHKEVNPAFVFSHFKSELKRHKNDYGEYAQELYSTSKLLNRDSLERILKMEYKEWVQAVKTDPLWIFYNEMKYYLDNDLNKLCGEYEDQIAGLRRIHMDALLRVFPERKFYPDANSTLRVTYGKVQGYYPKDGVHYLPQTYLEGVMEKYVPGDYEFDVPKKLQQLFYAKDYGIYGENGKMPLAFIGSNHTTGGNSGSPAIDAHGNLIGLNFDRVWEGTMSDINYDASICRNIMVDARYILFIIDKFAGAKWLIDEMKLVKPKRKK